jgi:hypothetical protein
MKLIDHFLIPKLKLLFEYYPELGDIEANYQGVIYHIENINMYHLMRLIYLDYPGNKRLDHVEFTIIKNKPSRFKAMVFLKDND